MDVDGKRYWQRLFHGIYLYRRCVRLLLFLEDLALEFRRARAESRFLVVEALVTRGAPFGVTACLSSSVLAIVTTASYFLCFRL